MRWNEDTENLFKPISFGGNLLGSFMPSITTPHSTLNGKNETNEAAGVQIIN